MAPKELNDKQRRFAAEYIVDLNATQAAKRAGYSERTAYSQGQRLLKHAEVSALISRGAERREKRTEITADYVLGGIKSIIERCIQVEPVLDRKGQEIPGQFQFEPHAALKGHELLGKHLKLFTEKHEHKFDLSNLTDQQINELASQLERTGEAAASGTAGA